MLVITRRVNEIIRIGDSIEVMVVRVDRGKVRIGISAPRSMSITREELVPLFDQQPEPAEAACDCDESDESDDQELGGEGGVT